MPQLPTDRFAVATGTVAAPCVVASRTYCAGSWKGIQEHLDYISSLGFDAVWISPVVANVEGTSAYGQAYHGYWAEDITNTHFGTPYDLKQLIQAINSAGMYVMLDVVANQSVVPSSRSFHLSTYKLQVLQSFHLTDSSISHTLSHSLLRPISIANALSFPLTTVTTKRLWNNAG